MLKPGGRLLVSVNHPGAYAIVYPEADYFAVTKYSEDYTFDGQSDVADLLAPTTARHDGCLHRRRASSRRHRQRATSGAGHPVRRCFPPGLEPGRSFLCFLFFVLEAV